MAADCFRDADLAQHCSATQITGFPHNLAPWLTEQARTRPGLVWCYTGALENHPHLIDRMAHVAQLAGNPGEQLRAVRSPGKLAAALAAADLKFPETRMTADGVPRDGSWLAKTYRGASGSGVAELRSKPLPRGAACQRRVPGTPCAAVYIGDGKTAVCLGVTRQLIGEAWTGGGPFQYCGSIGPIHVDQVIEAEIDRLGIALVDAFELKGLFGVDFLLNNEGVWTVEVNPRYTASVEVLEAAYEISAMPWHFDACDGRLCANELRADCREQGLRSGVRDFQRSHQIQDVRKSRKPGLTPRADHTVESARSVGKAIVFASVNCQVSEDLAARMLSTSSLQNRFGWGDVPRGGTVIPAGHPIATAFAAAESCDAVELQLQRQVADLQRQVTTAEMLPCE